VHCTAMAFVFVHLILYVSKQVTCRRPSHIAVWRRRDGHGSGRPAGRVGSKFLKCIIFVCQSS